MIRKLQLISLFIVIYSIAYSQNVLQDHHRDLSNGEHVKYYSNGNINVKLIIKDNLLTDYIDYNKDGSLSCYFRFKNGRYHGLLETYYGGNDFWKLYANNDTLMKSEFNIYYRDTSIPKKTRLYIRDSIPLKLIDDKYFEKDGIGHLGMDNCIYTKYHPNGVKSYSGMLINDKRYGLWLFYNKQGRLIKSKEY